MKGSHGSLLSALPTPPPPTLREDFGTERYESEAFQTLVRREFHALADGAFHAVDAARPIAAVHADIARIVRPVIAAARAGAPLQELWHRNPSQLPVREAEAAGEARVPPAAGVETATA